MKIKISYFFLYLAFLQNFTTYQIDITNMKYYAILGSRIIHLL